MIRIVAREQKYRFDKTAAYQYMYIMHVDQYSKLDQAKVLEEASAHSGIAKGALKGAWDAIGDVIKTWVTEGHSVAVPGLGTIRFSLQAKAVTDVNNVAKDLIRSRKVVFTPSVDIVNALKATGVAITCIDHNGQVVKRVQDDSSNEEVEGGDTVAAPVISGTTPFSDSTSMTISGPQGASIYYTTDGSTPTSSSTQYSSAVTLTATTTVKAIAILNGVSSSVTTKEFTKSSGGSGDGIE